MVFRVGHAVGVGVGSSCGSAVDIALSGASRKGHDNRKEGKAENEGDEGSTPGPAMPSD